MQPILLNPEEITATYLDGLLTIEASGQEDGVRKIRVVRDETEPIEPPPFRVQGEPSAAVGMFPYTASGEFLVDVAPQEITLQTPEGDRFVPVRILTSL
jgi:hypothetical protein